MSSFRGFRVKPVDEANQFAKSALGSIAYTFDE